MATKLPSLDLFFFPFQEEMTTRVVVLPSIFPESTGGGHACVLSSVDRRPAHSSAGEHGQKGEAASHQLTWFGFYQLGTPNTVSWPVAKYQGV